VSIQLAVTFLQELADKTGNAITQSTLLLPTDAVGSFKQRSGWPAEVEPYLKNGMPFHCYCVARVQVWRSGTSDPFLKDLADFFCNVMTLTGLRYSIPSHLQAFKDLADILELNDVNELFEADQLIKDSTYHILKYHSEWQSSSKAFAPFKQGPFMHALHLAFVGSMFSEVRPSATLQHKPHPNKFKLCP